MSGDQEAVRRIRQREREKQMKEKKSRGKKTENQRAKKKRKTGFESDFYSFCFSENTIDLES